MRINIYLTQQEKKDLSKLRDQYHLSFSTMATIIVNQSCIVAKYLTKGEGEEYRYKEKGYKTSIKPKKEIAQFYQNYRKLPILFTNLVKRYLRKDYKDIDEKTKTKLLNKIINEFKETFDPNWNGNEWQRRMPRLLRQNKEYYRKILDEC